MAYYNGNKVGSVVRPPLGLIQKTATLGEPGWHFASEDNADGYSAVYLNAPTMGDLKMWVSGDSAVTSLMLGSDIDNVVANIGDLFSNLTTLLIGNDTLVVGGLDTALTNAGNLTHIVVPNALEKAYKAQYSGLASKFTSWAYNAEFTIPFIGNTELTIAYVQQVVAMASGDISQVTKVVVPSGFTSYETDVFNYIFLKFVNATEIEYYSLRLPAEYQEVEYVQADGGQYFDIGLEGARNSNSLVDISDVEFTSSYSYPQYSGYNAFRNSHYGVTTDGHYTLEGGVNSTISAIGTRRKLTVSYTDSGMSIDIGGVETITRSGGYTLDDSTPYTLMGNSVGNNYKAKLYSCKIYNNSVLVRDFVPCYRKSDNVIGLYDLANGTFYTNAGTGTFLKGSDHDTLITETITRPALSTCTIYYDENTSHTLTPAIVQNTLTRVPEFSTAEKVIVPEWFTSYESGSITAIQNAFEDLSHLVTTYEAGTIDLDMNGDIVAKIVSIGKTVDGALMTAREISQINFIDDRYYQFSNGTNLDKSYAETLVILPPLSHKFETPRNYDGPFAYLPNLVYVPSANITMTGNWHSSWGNAFRDDDNAIEINFKYWSDANGSSWKRMFPVNNYSLKRLFITKMDSNPDINTDDNGSTLPVIEKLIWNGLVTSIVINNNCPMDRQGFVDFFNSIGTPSTSQTITIGATNLAKLTADDIAIATAKNWVLA